MTINWRGDLEWSNGTPIHFAPYDQGHLASHRDVSATPEWHEITGDNYVAVDAKSGEILGVAAEDHPQHVRNVAKNPPVWLHLFHGRTDPEGKDMPDGWGFNGPTIGPLDYVHVTYMCDVKFGFRDQHDAAKFGLESEGHLPIVGDMIEHNGAFYGDFSINAFKCTGLYRIDVIQKLDPDVVVQSERFDGTELEAEQRLGEIWNSNWAGHEAGRYKATLTCISGDGEAIRSTIEPLGDEEEDDD